MSKRHWFLGRQTPTMREQLARTRSISVSGAEDPPKGDDPPKSGDDPPKTEDPKPTDPLKTLTPEQQAAVNALVGTTRQEARETATAAAKAEAEKEALKKKDEYKKLFDDADAELTKLKPELETLKTENKSLEDAVADYIKPILEKLPALTKSLISDQKPVKQLQLLTEHKDELTDPPKRVPASKGGKKQDDPQPIGKAHVGANQKKIASRVNVLTGQQPG